MFRKSRGHGVNVDVVVVVLVLGGRIVNAELPPIVAITQIDTAAHQNELLERLMEHISMYAYPGNRCVVCDSLDE